jgi:hypothetical protein
MLWLPITEKTFEPLAKLAKAPLFVMLSEARIPFFQAVESLHFVQDDRTISFARGSLGNCYSLRWHRQDARVTGSMAERGRCEKTFCHPEQSAGSRLFPYL